jgi:osmotically-inducible protein OsmY
MTQRKSGEFRAKDSEPPARRSDFPRPDAEQVKEGAPAHEHERESGEHDAAGHSDEAHGYSQDSGYQGSGGYRSSGDAAANVVETRTQKPGNGHTHSDEQIRAHIQQRLLKERAPRARHLLVSVGQGVVTLSGEVDDEAERRRLTDLVRGVGSVREVHDELSTPGGRNDIN